MTDGSQLLDAIDLLTRPTRTVYVLTDDDGEPQRNEHGIECKTDVLHESLLSRLRSAIAGNATSPHAGSSDPQTRIPFDPGALKLYERIEDQIGEWFVGLTSQPVHFFPEQTLRAWYRAFELKRSREPASQTLEALEAEVSHKVWGWVRQVGDFFDPPKRMEITRRVQVPVVSPRSGERMYWPDGSLRVRLSTRPAACPRCDQATAFDQSTGDQITALVIEYRQSQEDDALNAAVAVCRSCSWRWAGNAKIRELRIEIDEWEERHAVPLG
jgi:hypothetical protein